MSPWMLTEDSNGHCGDPAVSSGAQLRNAADGCWNLPDPHPAACHCGMPEKLLDFCKADMNSYFPTFLGE